MDQVCDFYELTDNLVLICVDDGEPSLRAFNWYHKHFYRKEHTIGLVNIYALPEMTTFGKRHGDGNPLEALANDEYQKNLDGVLKERASVVHKYQELCAERGMATRVFSKEKKESVGQVICNIAKDSHATCIVMGPRGLGAFKRTLYGSVSEYVLHHSNITVLIVPPPKEQKCSK